MINKVILLGRLGQTPEVRQTGSSQVTNMSVATSKKYTARNGDRVETTVWHRVVAWGKLAEICGRYMSKGDMVYVEGELQDNEFENKDGVKIREKEVNAQVMRNLSPRDSSGGSAPNNNRQSSASAAPSGDNGGIDPSTTNDDEMPF